ncbi:hypothetical protein LTR64_008713 [Lithohypha guttulata]|uniref:uncharacterized protein n=1 Tax=Lithohypha guttulata TaxID=1690604 RepID=UPI00315CD0B3
MSLRARAESVGIGYHISTRATLSQSRPSTGCFKVRESPATDASQEPSDRRYTVSTLLATLQIHPAARRLRFLQRPVNVELATINAKLQSLTFDLSPFTPLTKLVANKASDLEIWRVVLQLIADLSRVTPPLSSIPPSFSGTPLRRSSASFRDSNQKREELRRDIEIELSRRTHVGVPEFISKYFQNKAWSEQVEKILKQLPRDDPLEGFPETSKPEEVDSWTWLKSFQEQHLGDAPNVFYRAESKSNITGATGERQLGVLLKSRAAASGEVHHLAD